MGGDLGQGGLWVLIRADSGERATARLPQPKAFETAPKTPNEEVRVRIVKSGVQDLDTAPSGWLTDHVPPPAQSITSVAGFQTLLELVQQQLRNGTLTQLIIVRPESSPIEILHLPLGGPWPDVIEADFVDAHGQLYHLFVDCYHGTGVWRDPTAVIATVLPSTSPEKD